MMNCSNSPRVFLSLVFAASALLAACDSSSDADDTGDAAVETTTGAVEDPCKDPGAFATPCSVGNSVGVGEYCTPGGKECRDNEGATICIVDVRPESRAYCTRACTSDEPCGEDAYCDLEDVSGLAGCVPNESENEFFEGDDID